MFEASLPGKSRWGLGMYRQVFFHGVGWTTYCVYSLIESYAKAEKNLDLHCIALSEAKGQTGQTGQTFKLDFPGNLCRAAFAILGMFNFKLVYS